MPGIQGEDLRRAAYRVLRTCARAIDLALLAVMVGSAVRVLFALDPGWNASAATAVLERLFGPSWAAVRGLAARYDVPLTFRGTDAAPILLFFGVLFVRNALNWRIDRLGYAEHKRRAQAALADATKQAGAGGRESDEEKARRLAAARRVAVASYTDAKAILEATKQDLTFLSLDVVGSTKMKRGEDPIVVEQAFADYAKMVDRIMKKHGAYKSTWTPDGQMAAFKSPQAAVDCGKEILLALPEFNAKVSKIKTPFALRVGANCGVVSTDDVTPMEKISDFSIDVAGHMQKHAEPDTIWVSKEVHDRLEDRSGFEPTGQEVDGRQVYAWRRPPAA